MAEEVIIQSDDIKYSEMFISDICVQEFREGFLVRTNTRKSDNVYITKLQLLEIVKLAIK